MLVWLSRFGCSIQCLPPPLEYWFHIWSREHDSFHVLAVLRFTAGGPQLGEIWVDLAEGREDFAMRRAKCVPIDCTGPYQRSCHVPVAKDHAKRRIAFPACQGDELSEALRIEVTQKPVARLAHTGPRRSSKS